MIFSIVVVAIIKIIVAISMLMSMPISMIMVVVVVMLHKRGNDRETMTVTNNIPILFVSRQRLLACLFVVLQKYQ